MAEPAAAALESVLRRVRGYLSEADQKVAASSSEPAASSLLEDAADRTRKALAEDSQWETRLDNE